MNKPIINIEKEIRALESQMSVHEDGRTIEGYAVVFNSLSEDMGFREIISPNAITEETIKNSDIIATFNHSTDIVLARSKNGEGTLQLEIDETGLKFSFEAPNTTAGNDLLESIKRGDVSGCSFAFSVDYNDPEAETWIDNGEYYLRTINKIERLYDVSIVVHPAYEATSVNQRSIDKVEEMKKEAEQRAEAEEQAAEKARVDALNAAYDGMLAEIDKL
jgi:hypothetical protein